MLLRLVFFFSVFLAASGMLYSQADYSSKWNRVDSLLNKKGLNQSALKEVNNIYALAKKERNEGQLIKALIYRLNLQQDQEENAIQKNISGLEDEIAQAKEPSKSILTSILASTYWNYFLFRRFSLYNRTAAPALKKTDILTWGTEDFLRTISRLFLASIHDQEILKQTTLNRYGPILVRGNVPYLRPTLYDLLAHRALDCFQTGITEETKPANAFELTDSAAFGDRDHFVALHLDPSDTASYHYKALLLFQDLIRFHNKDTDPRPVIDLDIARLEFLQRISVIEDKDRFYMHALQTITHQFPENPIAAKAWWLQAAYFAQKASAFEVTHDSLARFDYLKAKSICERVLEQADSSEGKTGCSQLLKNINRKALHLDIEKINIPGQPFRVLTSFKNIPHVYFRLLRTDPKTRIALQQMPDPDDKWNKLTGLPAIKSFDQDLPKPGDYQLHQTEIKVDALEPGEYALLAAADSLFTPDRFPLSIVFFYVSGIACIHSDGDYFVVNRETGKPLAGVDVQAWYKYYDNKLARQMERKGENFNTDKNGYFHILPARTANNPNLFLELTAAGDHLFLDDAYANFYDRNDAEEESRNKLKYEEEQRQTFFFTDRAIYRPGQTLYFKGIVTTKDFETHQSKIQAQFRTRVYLYDANDQKIDSVLLTTNDFGSYHGQFRLPENGLTGQFRIEDDSTRGSQEFSVEEYKRPKFFVEYEKPKTNYRLNETIRVKGFAKAYAGNVLDGAGVKYRVLRKAEFPYPLFGVWRYPQTGAQEIIHGESKTGADGSFSIEFRASPDLSIRPDQDPIFEFELNADITDLNGETRSGQTQIRVGYHALTLSIGLDRDQSMPVDSFNRLPIVTENLSGEFQPRAVSVRIFPLKSPDRLIRPRLWQEPDQFVMNKEEYIRQFPHDEYSNESNPETWERMAKVYETADSTRPGIPVKLKDLQLWPGWFQIEVTTQDDFGEEVRRIHYQELVDNHTGMPSMPKYFWTNSATGAVDPGTSAVIRMGSSAKDLFIIQQTERKEMVYQFNTLDHQQKELIYPISESDRGGFGVRLVFVKDNRFFSQYERVQVPWTNKQLRISYASFRDKTLPGSEEKWMIRISGYHREKLAAEVLAAMYDESLDQFKPFAWPSPNWFPLYYSRRFWNVTNNFMPQGSEERYVFDREPAPYIKRYDQLLEWQKTRRYMGPMLRGAVTKEEEFAPEFIQRRRDITAAVTTVTGRADSAAIEIPKRQEPPTGIQMRKNFNETAFFFPDLHTDDSGQVEFSFTIPESLTRWKWMSFAHTRDLSSGYREKSILTQKQLMIQSNAPRFLRQGDHLEFPVKIVNLTDSEMTGMAQLQLIDPATQQSVDGWFSNRQANQYFTAGPGQSTSVSFPIEVPFQYNKPVGYRIIAKSVPSPSHPEFSDGEEATLPVMSNRMLVTESLPLNMRGPGTKTFSFDRLLNSGSSESLEQHALTVEFTSNPAWYAVQALPWLAEFPYECAEQTFNRFYANALAFRIAGSSPQLEKVFERWRKDSSSLQSNLQKNEELKSTLLRETPWVLESMNEETQKKNLAILLDSRRMNREIPQVLDKLAAMQSEGGGFPWFKDGPDDRFITQYILSGMGHLKKLNAVPAPLQSRIDGLCRKALAWLDKKIKEDYDAWLKSSKKIRATPTVGDIQIQYLYLRSFFPEIPIPAASAEAILFYRGLCRKSWLSKSKFMQAMIALSLFRNGDLSTAKDILASAKQQAIQNEEMGMYWKDIQPAYYWYQAPVETQAIWIEAFSEINSDTRSVDELRVWLLKQKQVQHWRTTKATADACYALLLKGENWLGNEPRLQIRVGSVDLLPARPDSSGTGEGYLKKRIEPPFIKPDMGHISVRLQASPTGKPGPAWGAVYWQYFEDMDKIQAGTGLRNPLTLSKKIFIKKNTDRGPVLEPIHDNDYLKIGDRITVRIELTCDRVMEYVHMKDLRAACMEPTDVLSSYKWQDGLGYYQSTRDAATHFFFDRIPKGTFVFEYDLLVSQAGSFSNGITQIQCMYAPEFMSHSEGLKVNVEAKD